MIRINQVRIRVEAPSQEKLLRKKAASLLKIQEGEIRKVHILRRSVDARKKPDIFYSYVADVELAAGAGAREDRIVRRAKNPDVSVAERVDYSFPGPLAEEERRNFGERKALEHRPVVIGFGPAGMFCAYFLAKAGYRPIVLERGADVDARRADVERFWETGCLDPNSNVQFGEGGAGTFSDGKLNTLVKDKYGRNDAVLRTLVEFGAPESILYDAKPHIGTDELSRIVKNMREEILRLGGEIRFRSQVTALRLTVQEQAELQEFSRSLDREDSPRQEDSPRREDLRERESTSEQDDSLRQGGSSGQENSLEQQILLEQESHLVQGAVLRQARVCGLVVNGKEVLPCELAVLAIGHSARDTLEELYREGIPMEAKDFAVGLRVEHPQSMINRNQYGEEALEALKILGAAPYKLTARASDGRGVYSFCMCPGGYVVNASSEPGRLAVNGMSYSDRGGENANSAIIVSVTPKDYGSDAGHPLAGIEFQRRLEEKAYELGGGRIPVQRYGDFRLRVMEREGKSGAEPTGNPLDACFLEENQAAGSDSELRPQNKGGWQYGDLSGILPQACNLAFVEGMARFGQMIPGFDRPDALLSGVESRTSSPVRIPRDDSLQSVGTKGLYPCGEGAGYAGGITSAAMDGIRAAEGIVKRWAPCQDSSRLCPDSSSG